MYRGFGFVTFASADAVDKVMQNCPHELDGKKVNQCDFFLNCLGFFISYDILELIALI